MSRPSPSRQRLPRGSGEQLRAEIVTAARALMAAATTADSVSMRAVADAVGVTPPSIYRHFSDKEELLTAVVVAVFEQLDEAMRSAAAGLRQPLDRLHAFALAYITFAVSHPEEYRLATMDPCPRPDVDTMLQDGAWLRMHGVITECVEAGVLGGDPLELALELWSAAHGLAALMIAKPFLPWGDPEALVKRMFTALVRGHADS